MTLNDTPSGERTQIGFFGVRNAGKSSLVNAVTGQDLAVVSDEDKGIIECTLTEPVSEKARLLLDVFAFGIENIAEAYGNRFIRLKN